MKEFSLEFLIVRNSPFGFLVGWSGYFFQQLKLDFLDKVKDSIFVAIKG